MASPSAESVLHLNQVCHMMPPQAHISTSPGLLRRCMSARFDRQSDCHGSSVEGRDAENAISHSQNVCLRCTSRDGRLIITGRLDRMTHRKWRETKQQPSRAISGHEISCCLVSLHFLLCDILSGRPVHIGSVR